MVDRYFSLLHLSRDPELYIPLNVVAGPQLHVQIWSTYELLFRTYVQCQTGPRHGRRHYSTIRQHSHVAIFPNIIQTLLSTATMSAFINSEAHELEVHLFGEFFQVFFHVPTHCSHITPIRPDQRMKTGKSNSKLHSKIDTQQLILMTSFWNSLEKPVSECHTILNFNAGRDNGSSGGDKWNSMTWNAPVTSPPSTYQHSVFLQAGCPSCSAVSNVKALNDYIHFN